MIENLALDADAPTLHARVPLGGSVQVSRPPLTPSSAHISQVLPTGTLKRVPPPIGRTGNRSDMGDVKVVAN